MKLKRSVRQRRFCQRRTRPAPTQGLFAILGAEDKVDMVLCAAVGHVFSDWAGNLKPPWESVATYGARVSLAHSFPGLPYPNKPKPGLPGAPVRTRARLVRPAGAGVWEGAQRKYPRKDVLLSIVTEAFARFHNADLSLFLVMIAMQQK
jgi:hypothetical protein